MLISHCNMKSWEIAIMSGDSSNIHDALDGSVIFITSPPPGGGICTACHQQHIVCPHHSAEVTGSVCPSHLWVLSTITFMKGFHCRFLQPNSRGLTGMVPCTQVQHPT